jgi:hypothetical protein
MTYKSAQKFDDYMRRSNRFVERILAGGNRIEVTEIENESDGEMMLAALNRLIEIKTSYLDRLMITKREKSILNNETFGKPDRQLNHNIMMARRRANDAYRKARSDVQHIDWHITLIHLRLRNLGVELPTQYFNLNRIGK